MGCTEQLNPTDPGENQKYQKSAEKVQNRNSRECAGKVSKKCRKSAEGTPETHKKCRKSAEKVRKQSKKYKNMNTKGAGAEGARPLCGGGRRPPSIISDSLHIPRLEKLTAGYFRPTVGIFSLSAVLQSAPAASLRLLFRLFFGYLPRRRLRVFFCYLWAISGFLWNSMAVVGSGHHKFQVCSAHTQSTSLVV